MLQVRGSFAKDLLVKYALLHSKKDSRAFTLSADDRVKMNHYFEDSCKKGDSSTFIPILQFFLSDHTNYADVPKKHRLKFSFSDQVNYAEIPREHRVASVGMFIYEMLRYFRNGRRSPAFEKKVGELMVHMSQTHKLKFIPHK